MAVVQLTGVIEDGTSPDRRSPLAPLDPRQTIEMTLGEDARVEFALYFASGVQVDLTSPGNSATLAIRKFHDDSLAVFKGAATPVPTDGQHRADWTIPASALNPRRWDPGRYVYQVTASVAGKTSVAVGLSACILQPSGA
jgi:hypothetical protein